MIEVHAHVVGIPPKVKLIIALLIFAIQWIQKFISKKILDRNSIFLVLCRVLQHIIVVCVTTLGNHVLGSLPVPVVLRRMRPYGCGMRNASVVRVVATYHPPCRVKHAELPTLFFA